jgi:hypothetical protein
MMPNMNLPRRPPRRTEKTARQKESPEEREKKKAKMRWKKKLAKGCRYEDFTMASKEARKVCIEIEKGFTGHLSKIKPPQFAKPDGLNATADDDNANILKNHFQAVFDRRYVTTEETSIYDIEELDIHGDLKEELRSIPEIEEFKRAIHKMKRETAPGIMGLTPDMLKALPEKALEYYNMILG